MNHLSLHDSVASKALSHSLLNFKIFLGEHAPQPPDKTVHALDMLERRMASDEREGLHGNEASARTENCVLRAPHQSLLYRYAPPPFFNLCIRPCESGVYDHGDQQAYTRQRWQCQHMLQLPKKDDSRCKHISRVEVLKHKVMV